jgi:serine/threonine protein phosphatase 1
LRTLAIGDIHGCWKALQALVAAVKIQPDDLIVTLGDYVDRGPESRAVLEWLLTFRPAEKLVAIRGNHEVMMLAARGNDDERYDDWLHCGGRTTLASYVCPGEHGTCLDVPQAHWDFLETETRAWYETPTHFFVHANAYEDHALVDQPDYMLYWEPFIHPRPHSSGKIMVCGHTVQKSGRPRNLGHAVCIDTGSNRGEGWLTCLDVESGRYWQANQRGEIRDGFLELARE